MNIDKVIAKYNKCYWTHKDKIHEVWEPAERYYKRLPPNRIGCVKCNEMVKIKW